MVLWVCVFMPEFFVSVLMTKPNFAHRIERNWIPGLKNLMAVESLYLRSSIEMEKSQFAKEASKTSTEFIISNLRSIRDSKINDLLKTDDSMMSFLEEHYNTIAMSPIKREFLKRDLIELKGTSLDLVHYSSLIKEVKEIGNLLLMEGHPLFNLELKAIFQRHGF